MFNNKRFKKAALCFIIRINLILKAFHLFLFLELFFSHIILINSPEKFLQNLKYFYYNLLEELQKNGKTSIKFPYCLY